MKAAVLVSGRTAPEPFLQIEEVPVRNRSPAICCCEFLRVAFAGPTCTLPKEICRRFTRGSFPATRLWVKWPAVRLQSCRWEAGPESPGSAVWMGVAGTVTTAWRISATSRRLLDTR